MRVVSTSDSDPSFDSFVVGGSNRFAFAAAVAVAEAPARAYNPLLIKGLGGVGKTHLLHAIAQGLVGMHPASTSACISSSASSSDPDEVADRVAEHCRTGISLLLIDDVDALLDSPGTPALLGAIADAIATGVQVVLAGELSARAAHLSERRIIKDFECGLVADIQPPDLETRLAIQGRRHA